VGCVISGRRPSESVREIEERAIEYLPDLVGVALADRFGREEEGFLNNSKGSAGGIGHCLMYLVGRRNAIGAVGDSHCVRKERRRAFEVLV
jgi:hypothetical protein